MHLGDVWDENDKVPFADIRRDALRDAESLEGIAERLDHFCAAYIEAKDGT